MGSSTIGAEGGTGDGGELLAGVDVLEDGFVEAGEVLVAFLEHGLYAIRLEVEPHILLLGGGVAASA